MGIDHFDSQLRRSDPIQAALTRSEWSNLLNVDELDSREQSRIRKILYPHPNALVARHMNYVVGKLVGFLEKGHHIEANGLVAASAQKTQGFDEINAAKARVWHYVLEGVVLEHAAVSGPRKYHPARSDLLRLAATSYMLADITMGAVTPLAEKVAATLGKSGDLNGQLLALYKCYGNEVPVVINFEGEQMRLDIDAGKISRAREKWPLPLPSELQSMLGDQGQFIAAPPNIRLLA